MKKQNKKTESFKKVTIIFGYSLFGLLLVAVTLSTIVPFSSLLMSPGVRLFNVWTSLISLVAGAILPPLLSYVIGDRATHSKSKIDHHFNGVLFGIASYWLSLFFSFVASDGIAEIRARFSEPLASVIVAWPIFATLILLAVVAMAYIKSQKKQPSLLEYRPFQFTLFGGLIATLVYMLLNQYYVASTLWAISVLYVVIPVALIGVSFKLLPAKYYASPMAGLSLAVVAVSIGFIGLPIAGQLLPYSAGSMMIPALSGMFILAVYLALMRHLSGAKS